VFGQAAAEENRIECKVFEEKSLKEKKLPSF